MSQITIDPSASLGLPLDITNVGEIAGATENALVVGAVNGALTPLPLALDGEILIGSTGNTPTWSNITSTSGTVTVTNGAGSINIETVGSKLETLTGGSGGAVGADAAYNIDIIGGGNISIVGNPAINSLTVSDITTDQEQVLYVGKHGSDSNDGKSIERAFLTFGAAILAANSGDAIVCFDGGEYTEDLYINKHLNIFARSASLVGNHELTLSSYIDFESFVANSGNCWQLNRNGVEGVIICRSMYLYGSSYGFNLSQGVYRLDLRDIDIVDGGLINPASKYPLDLKFNDIEISGTGTVFGGVNGCILNIIGTSVENTGVGNGTLFVTSGAGAPEIHANITRVDVEKLSDITAGSICNLNVARLTGTLAEAGAGNVTIGGCTKIENVPIGASIPSTGKFTTLESATSFKTASTVATTATVALEVNKNYQLERAGGVTATLPAVGAIGDKIKIRITEGSGSIAQNASQYIRLGTSLSTTGVGGSIASTAVGDCIELECTETNNGWMSTNGWGNWTVV